MLDPRSGVSITAQPPLSRAFRIELGEGIEWEQSELSSLRSGQCENSPALQCWVVSIEIEAREAGDRKSVCESIAIISVARFAGWVG